MKGGQALLGVPPGQWKGLRAGRVYTKLNIFLLRIIPICVQMGLLILVLNKPWLT